MRRIIPTHAVGKEARDAAHVRSHHGTSCYRLGRCRLPNSYLYDADLIPRVVQYIRLDGRFNDTSVWVVGERRLVWLVGCVNSREQADALQKALAEYLAGTICKTIAEAVHASRVGEATERDVIDLTFDAFDREGGGALASWMLLSGNEDALDPIVEAIHDLVDDVRDSDPLGQRELTLTLVLMALGDALLGGPLSQSLEIPRTAVRDRAERMLIAASVAAKVQTS